MNTDAKIERAQAKVLDERTAESVQSLIDVLEADRTDVISSDDDPVERLRKVTEKVMARRPPNDELPFELKVQLGRLKYI